MVSSDYEIVSTAWLESGLDFVFILLYDLFLYYLIFIDW